MACELSRGEIDCVVLSSSVVDGEYNNRLGVVERVDLAGHDCFLAHADLYV